MLIDETDEELLDRIEAVIHILVSRHRQELVSLKTLIQETVNDALED